MKDATNPSQLLATLGAVVTLKVTTEKGNPIAYQIDWMEVASASRLSSQNDSGLHLHIPISLSRWVTPDFHDVSANAREMQFQHTYESTGTFGVDITAFNLHANSCESSGNSQS